MHRRYVVRALTALALLASVSLPYAAAAACTVTGPEMMAPAHAMSGAHAMTDAAHGPGGCDFADCATAPAAPVAEVVTAPATRAPAAVRADIPSRRLVGTPVPPLTPPPQL